MTDLAARAREVIESILRSRTIPLDTMDAHLALTHENRVKLHDAVAAFGRECMAEGLERGAEQAMTTGAHFGTSDMLLIPEPFAKMLRREAAKVRAGK